MIALVDSRMQAGFDDALRAMFVARKEVFVDLLGWDIPVLENQFELDHFDDVHARYLILVDGAGHLGSARLLPTARPHILDSLFPALCAGPIPRGDTILEITRFCLDRRLNARRRREVRNRLVTALVLHALAEGIETYTGVAEAVWLDQIVQFGWDARRLGQSLQAGGHRLGALSIAIGAETPQLLKQTGIWMPTALLRAAPSEGADA